MKVVVVGCTHTGVAAVTQVLQEYPGTEVTVYERHDNVSFLSCGIPLYLNGEVKRLENMMYSSPEELESMGAKVRIKHDVLKIDAAKKELTVENLRTAEVFTDSYDKLIMATGSSVVVPPLLGIDHSRVLLCKDYDQAQEIYETTKHYHHVAIVGGGYVGVELAESYANTEHQVTLIQGNRQLLNNYVDEEFSNRVVKLLEENEVEVHLNEYVQSFSGDEDEPISVKTSENDYQADLVIVATGFVANTDLLRGQVDMTKAGAIKVNEYMKSSDPDIFAGGDAAVVHYNPTGRDLYIPLATNAIRQGLLAGRNIFGDVQKNLGTQASSALQIFGYTLASSGITLRNALNAGINADSVLFEDNYRPDYMPTTTKISIVLVYDKDTRRVLGAQLLSKHEVAQSANTVSVLIQNNNTIDDMAYVDMLFQPHFDFQYNYLNLVAQLAVVKELNLKSKG